MIPVYQPYFVGNEKKYVNDCLDAGWISSRGEYIGKFEGAFCQFTGAEYATSVSNGTVAIHLALEAIGIRPGDEIILPTFTYVASVNPILQIGATPVYADSSEHSWQIDPDDIRRRITPRTRAVLIAHLYGLPCDMDPILEICRAHDLLLIEDAAEGFGTFYKGRHVGTFGDVGAFSFFGNKTITTGEGGMVTMKDSAVAERARHLKNQGVSPVREYWHDAVAFNYRMTNICAAIGLAQLEGASEILKRKRDIAGWYREGLKALPLTFLDQLPETVHSYWMCSIALHDATKRQALRDFLLARGVETRPAFHPLHTLPHCASDGHFPVAEKLSKSAMNLPSYPALQQEQVDYICTLISEFLG